MARALAMLAITLAAATHAHAQTVIGLHLVTAHVPNRGQEGVNPGLYSRFSNGLTLGAYRNSLDRLSVYGGITFNVAGPVDLTLGAVTGYKREEVAVPSKTVMVPVGDGSVMAPVQRCSNGDRPPCHVVRGLTPHNIAPLVAPSIRLPEVMGVVPRVSVMLGGQCTAVHLSIERAF